MSELSIRVLSDLHLEFSNGQVDIPSNNNDNNTILLLLGDIGIAKTESTYVPFITEMSHRFRHVIYIMGNHEHWKGKFPCTYNKIWYNLVELDNVTVLEKDSVVIDNVAFIGATLWTNMNNNNPITMFDAKLKMNDYARIRNGPDGEPWKRKLDPEDTVADHITARNYIFAEIKSMKELGLKVVVMTHHAPSYWSLSESKQGDSMNGAYVNNLTNAIVDIEDNMQPDIWCHGHVHNNSDYTIGQTRVICNPRGYHGVGTNKGFDPLLTIQV